MNTTSARLAASCDAAQRRGWFGFGHLLGDVQDASAEILASFASEDAEKLRRDGWKTFVKWMNQLSRSRGGAGVDFGEDKKKQWMIEHQTSWASS